MVGRGFEVQGPHQRPNALCLCVSSVLGIPRRCPPPRRIRPQSLPMMPIQPGDSFGGFQPAFAPIASIEST
jgi:hypothetical protein